MIAAVPDRAAGEPDHRGVRGLTPERYAVTETGLALRIAERYGCGRPDPLAWWDALTPGKRRVLIAQEIVRVAEQDRADARQAGYGQDLSPESAMQAFAASQHRRPGHA